MSTDRAMTAGPSGSTPARVPGSIRRTTSIEMDMSDGQVLVGRARDLVTPKRGDAVIVDEASFTARIGEYRAGQPIEEISCPSIQKAGHIPCPCGILMRASKRPYFWSNKPCVFSRADV